MIHDIKQINIEPAGWRRADAKKISSNSSSSSSKSLSWQKILQVDKKFFKFTKNLQVDNQSSSWWKSPSRQKIFKLTKKIIKLIKSRSEPVEPGAGRADAWVWAPVLLCAAPPTATKGHVPLPPGQPTIPCYQATVPQYRTKLSNKHRQRWAFASQLAVLLVSGGRLSLLPACYHQHIQHIHFQPIHCQVLIALYMSVLTAIIKYTNVQDLGLNWLHLGRLMIKL